jgi:LAO/AO transport system kinase
MSDSHGRRRDPAALAAGVLSGDRLALSRSITLVENERPGAHDLLSALFPHTGRAHIVGVTGAPGTGKSTLVTALAQAYRTAGQTVAIAAIDPSSPFTGGALLGDRVRMRALSGDPGVFIRSMATRGSLGGLAKTTNDIVMALDAAGFDRVIVETVGVGQAEVEIASTAHTTLVVEAPGLGDEVQAIKAGILEIADLLVVNKADRPGADRTIRALELMLEIEADGPRQVYHHGSLVQLPADPLPDPAHEWHVDILKTTAATGEGVLALMTQIEAHRVWLHESGALVARERLRIAHTLETIMRAELNRRIAAAMPQDSLSTTIEAIRNREIDPYRAAEALLRQPGDG